MNRRHASALAATAVVIGSAIGFGEITARGEGELPGQTFLVSEPTTIDPNGSPIPTPSAATAPSLSGDGRFVVWGANATCPTTQVAFCNLALLKDRTDGSQRAVTVQPFGPEPVISRDGRTAVVVRTVTNVQGATRWAVFTFDPLDPALSLRQVSSLNFLSQPVRQLAVSGNGRFVAYTRGFDTGETELVLIDLTEPRSPGPFLERVPVDVPTYSQALGTTSPALSNNGDRLVFQSDINPQDGLFQTLQQVYVWETAGSTFTLVSDRVGQEGNGHSVEPDISGDGQVVAFASSASNLADLPPAACPGGCPFRVYVRDLSAAGPELVARDQQGQVGQGSSSSPSLSLDGSVVVFEDEGGDLVEPAIPPGELGDIVLVDRIIGRRTRISVDPAGGPTPLDHRNPDISSTGRFVAFDSFSANGLLGRDDLQGFHELVRDRPGTLTITPLDFGAVTVGGPPEFRTATVTNTNGATFEIAAVGSNDGEFAVAGGSCGPGTKLAPAQSCTVDVAYTPAGDGAGSGTLTIASAPGFDANPSGAGSLKGSGQPPPTTPTVDTTPPTDPTTTEAPPPPTAPAVNSLTISPPQASFPATPLAVTSGAQAFTVRNTGTQSNSVTTAALIGANPGDYLVTSDGCAGVNLAPNATCSVGVAFRPTATGARPATVRVNGTGGSSASAILAGDGASAPTLVFSPAVARGGTVTIAIGGGFPASTALALTGGGQSGPLSVTTDAIGAFRLPIVVRGGALPGTLTLTVTGVPGQFDSVSAPLLVVLGTYQPQNGTGPAFGNSSILSRG